MKTEKSENLTLKIPEYIVWRIVEGEAVILNRKEGWYYSLNKIGTEIFKLVNMKYCLKKIIETITIKYRIDRKRAEKDILDLLKNLKKEKILSFERN